MMAKLPSDPSALDDFTAQAEEWTGKRDRWSTIRDTLSIAQWDTVLDIISGKPPGREDIAALTEIVAYNLASLAIMGPKDRKPSLATKRRIEAISNVLDKLCAPLPRARRHEGASYAAMNAEAYKAPCP